MSLNNFEGFGKGVREITHAKLVAFAPLLVNEEMYHKWNNYSETDQAWILKGHMLNPSFQGDVEPIRPYIWRYDANKAAMKDDGPAPYSPAWQMSPPPMDTSIINFNYQSDAEFSSMIQNALEPMQSYLSPPMDMSELFGSAAPSAGEDPDSLLVQPVLDSFNPDSAQVVGHILAVLPWSSVFGNVSAIGNTYQKDNEVLHAD